MRARFPLVILALWFVAPVSVVVPAAAQTNDDRKWEVEIYGGGMWPTDPSGGTTSLPAPGQVFTTATTMPTPAPSSRRESSWYFGDGAVLFNQAVSALAMLPGRISTLDPVLGRSLGAQSLGRASA